MKSKFYIFACLLAVICMLCSCGGGSGSADGEAQKAVAVSFAVSSPDGRLNKIISATSTNVLSTAVYQYKATPNWTSEFGAIQGTQADWKDFTVTTGKGNVGYFAVGSWTFEVRVVDSSKTYTLYQTQKGNANANPIVPAGVTTYVNTSVTANNPIEIEVFKESDGKGTIAFGGASPNTLSAPTCGEGEKLIATYGKVGDSAIGQPLNLTEGTADAGFTPFTGSIPNVDAGIYWVTVTRNDGTNNVGSSTTMVEIYGGQTETIKGTVEAGKWVDTFFKIVGIKTISGTISTTATLPVVKNASPATTSVALKLTGEITENGNVDTTATAAMKYYLTVGDSITSVTPGENGAYSLDVTSLDPGDYYVGLIVVDKDNTISANAATPIKVTIKPAP